MKDSAHRFVGPRALALALVLALVIGFAAPGVYAQNATQTAAAAATQTAAAVATQTANAVATQTAAAQATATAVLFTPTPLSNPRGGRLADELNRSSRQADALKLGSRLVALWHGRQTGGALAVNGGDAAKFDIAAGTYVVNGIYVPAATAAAATAQVLTASTTASQYKKVTVCVDAVGSYHQVNGGAAASQGAAGKAPCRDDWVEVAYIELPTSFTATSTHVTTGMLKQAATAASQLGTNGTGQF